MDFNQNNGDKGWWKHEVKIAAQNKDVDEPIIHYLRLFEDIQSSRHGITKNRGTDITPNQTLIKFPKNRDAL